jgi:signal transduction histidine kinase
MSENGSPERLGVGELRTLFLFEALDAEQLAWLSQHGRVERHAAGELVYSEDAPATCFFVLLTGELALLRRVEGVDVETTRSDQRGAYAGATQAYIRTQQRPHYPGSMRSITDTTFFVLPADDFAEATRAWFPMAMHLLEGLFYGMRASQAIIGQRERLLALGRMSAGLTHELNNPAAAAVRATSSLRERVAAMRQKLAKLADGRVDGDTLRRLTIVQEDAVARIPKAPKLTPLQTSDAEDELSDWLDDHDVADGWQVAPTLVAAGIGADWLDDFAASCAPDQLETGLRWVAYTLETELLMNEIEDSTKRISHLVEAAKQYTHLDRAGHQDIDLHDGLDSTLVMLSAKLSGIDVVKDYDRDLPPVPAYPAELNQVWTNLIDNAIGAMEGSGTLTLRTALDGEQVLVEVGDTGPGVPPELARKIFEPFFTTKPIGKGTGLGLDISYRVIAQRHGGDLSVLSRPGDTRFQVRLPLHAPSPPEPEPVVGNPAETAGA